MIIKLANISSIDYANEAHGISYVIKGDEFGLNLGKNLDVEAEKRMMIKDLEYNQGFKRSVESKLANEKFVANAKPEIIERERAKLADAKAKIKAIEEALERL